MPPDPAEMPLTAGFRSQFCGKWHLARGSPRGELPVRGGGVGIRGVRAASRRQEERDDRRREDDPRAHENRRDGRVDVAGRGQRAARAREDGRQDRDAERDADLAQRGVGARRRGRSS